MARSLVIPIPSGGQGFIVVEKDGTKTSVWEGYTGMMIRQRRPDGQTGTFSTYEDYGLALFPHLLRFLYSMNGRAPPVPRSSKMGNDTFVSTAKTMLVHTLHISYPFSYADPGFLGERVNSIRAVNHPLTNESGLLVAEGPTHPVFLSPFLMRALVRELPKMYPHIHSYRIMAYHAMLASRKRGIRKPVFEKGVPFEAKRPIKLPVRARKGFERIVERYHRIKRRK